MRGAVELRTDGCTDLQLDSSKHYIVTKWYGSSLAIFEEAAFHQYLRRLIRILRTMAMDRVSSGIFCQRQLL